jgi:hypothetical protein
MSQNNSTSIIIEAKKRITLTKTTENKQVYATFCPKIAPTYPIAKWYSKFPSTE